jgi:hypothetical protein
MPLFRINDRNILHIHVPKTGGTTIEQFMGRFAPMNLHNRGKRLFRPARQSLLAFSLPLQHLHGDLLEDMFSPGFFDYSFMIVRDPVERMKSEYRHARARNRCLARLPFDHWLRLSLNLAHTSPGYSNNHFRDQASFECLGAEVFRFEDGLQSVARQVCDRLAIPCPNDLPHARRGPEMDLSVSRNSRDLVRTFFARDYERYGYA